MFYSCQTAWQSPLSDESVLGAGAGSSLQLPELRLAPSTSPLGFCHLYTWEIWAYLFNSLAEEGGQENAGRAVELKYRQSRTRGGCAKTGSWSYCFPECCRGAGESHPPASALYQSTAGGTQLSCSQDTSSAPDLHCCKADMLRVWIMVIQR